MDDTMSYIIPRYLSAMLMVSSIAGLVVSGRHLWDTSVPWQLIVVRLTFAGSVGILIASVILFCMPTLRR